MRVGIIGLGLMGGSLAKALFGKPEIHVAGADLSAETEKEALAQSAVNEIADAESIFSSCDVTILAVPPRAAVSLIEKYSAKMPKGATLSDICGVKRPILAAAKNLPKGCRYVGGHPMAGKEKGGFANSTHLLFRDAHFIVVPEPLAEKEHIDRIKRLIRLVGCRDIVVTDAETHDERIAYTSQLMHVLAAALCASGQHMLSKGFEGGSFRGAVRVADIDAPLWTELFSMNSDALVRQISELEKNLADLRGIIESGDEKRICESLKKTALEKEKWNEQSVGES
ncbi:MAG: prephenate dehydrogenase [Eubacteriales bacterium]|nr:prephenate dehydrogenase [Eubacteriales bacterium]MDD3881625.1 prephenate dehydrogenase [Eubacteriales bacterium]MDD4512316.1 prephenate dehydrogenase [Eubacteriales bacterium]